MVIKYAVAGMLVTLTAMFVNISPTMAQTKAHNHPDSPAVTVAASGARPASCDNVGIVYEAQVGEWVNFCGLGLYYEPSGGWTVTQIEPHTDNRWWLHQNSNGSGWAVCFQFQSNGPYFDIPSEYQHPGNILVSDNTAPC
jgi:hypothetical protein